MSVNESTDREVRMWAVDLVHRYATELAIGSLRMGLQVADALATYVMTGAVPEKEILLNGTFGDEEGDDLVRIW